MRSEENSEAAETCGRADGDVEDLRRTGGEGVETCGRAGGGVGDPRRTGQDGSEAGENRGASFEGTWPTAQEWAEFDLWDAEEERRLAAGGDLEPFDDCDDEELEGVSRQLSDGVSGQLSVVSGMNEQRGRPEARRGTRH